MTEPLTIQEKIKLRAYKDKIANLIVMWGVGVFVFLLIVCFIPMGLLPKKRRVEISNPDLSIFDSMGVFPTFAMLLIIAGGLAAYLYFSYKYPKLVKDLSEQKKVILDVTVRNIIYKQGGGPQEIALYFSPPYQSINKIDFIGEKQLPPMYKNQEIQLIITKNALYPLQVKPKNDINEIMNVLSKIQQESKQKP